MRVFFFLTFQRWICWGLCVWTFIYNSMNCSVIISAHKLFSGIHSESKMKSCSCTTAALQGCVQGQRPGGFCRDFGLIRQFLTWWCHWRRSQGTAKVITPRPEGEMNVCTKCHHVYRGTQKQHTERGPMFTKIKKNCDVIIRNTIGNSMLCFSAVLCTVNLSALLLNFLW